MEPGYIIGIISFLLPTIAAIIIAKGPKKYKSAYINFLYFSLGFVLGIVLFFGLMSLQINNNQETLTVDINIIKYDYHTTVFEIPEDKVPYNITIGYSCIITNVGKNPTTIVSLQLLASEDIITDRFLSIVDIYLGNSNLDLPLTIQPNDSVKLKFITLQPIDTDIINKLTENFDITKPFSLLSASDYLAKNLGMDIYGNKLYFKNSYKYLVPYMETDTVPYLFAITTAKDNEIIKPFGHYMVYPIE